MNNLHRGNIAQILVLCILAMGVAIFGVVTIVDRMGEQLPTYLGVGGAVLLLYLFSSGEWKQRRENRPDRCAREEEASRQERIQTAIHGNGIEQACINRLLERTKQSLSVNRQQVRGIRRAYAAIPQPSQAVKVLYHEDLAESGEREKRLLSLEGRLTEAMAELERQAFHFHYLAKTDGDPNLAPFVLLDIAELENVLEGLEKR